LEPRPWSKVKNYCIAIAKAFAAWRNEFMNFQKLRNLDVVVLAILLRLCSPLLLAFSLSLLSFARIFVLVAFGLCEFFLHALLFFCCTLSGELDAILAHEFHDRRTIRNRKHLENFGRFLFHFAFAVDLAL